MCVLCPGYRSLSDIASRRTAKRTALQCCQAILDLTMLKVDQTARVAAGRALNKMLNLTQGRETLSHFVYQNWGVETPSFENLGD